VWDRRAPDAARHMVRHTNLAVAYIASTQAPVARCSQSQQLPSRGAIIVIAQSLI
jgi:hypothetical protein